MFFTEFPVCQLISILSSFISTQQQGRTQKNARTALPLCLRLSMIRGALWRWMFYYGLLRQLRQCRSNASPLSRYQLYLRGL